MRCRLILSSGGRSLEGFGCSPIKRVRELGLIRRESVWSLSSGGIISKKKGQTFQYERTNRLCFHSVPIVCNICKGNLSISKAKVKKKDENPF